MPVVKGRLAAGLGGSGMRREDGADGAKSPSAWCSSPSRSTSAAPRCRCWSCSAGCPPRYRVQVAVLQDAGPLMGSVPRLGFAPEVFPLNGSLARPNTALQVARLARWLRRNRVELVHVHDFYSTMLVVPAAKLAGTKVIVGRLDLAHWHGRARRAVLQRLTRMADHVVANAEAIRRMLVQEEGLPAGARLRHPQRPGSAALRRAGARGAARRRLPDTGGAPVVVHVANMNHPVKRQEDLLRALAHAAPRGARSCTPSSWAMARAGRSWSGWRRSWA